MTTWTCFSESAFSFFLRPSSLTLGVVDGDGDSDAGEGVAVGVASVDASLVGVATGVAKSFLSVVGVPSVLSDV